jgi:hypothetical protein
LGGLLVEKEEFDETEAWEEELGKIVMITGRSPA